MTLQEQKFHIWQKKQSSTNKKVRNLQIALNDYNVLFFDIFLKSENIFWESAIYK